MSTYETTAGLGDERVRILPRRGLVKNHYYTRDTHESWRLCGAIVVISWRGGDAERYKSQTRDETFVSEASFLGPPESHARMGERRRCGARKSLTREETFVTSNPPQRFLNASSSWGPRKSRIFGESRGLGRPLIKQSGNQPLRLKCRMRVQNYCFFLTWQWLVPRLVQSVSPDL